MLFNSLIFAIFLPIVFFIYWFVVNKNLKIQNAFIVLASFVFYGWWDWRFLFLIIISIVEDYFVALKLHETNDAKKRKLWLFVSVAVNLSILGFFKYYNFFIENFILAFSVFGLKPNITSLNIILPVGISFYTFQTMSYTIDVYYKKLEPTKDIIAFAAFVSFFPLLVAGPIERATNLLSQFFYKRKFDYTKAVDGMRQILWGLFKKIVIADNCAEYANYVFANYQQQSSITLFFGALFFSFQLYCDFSGYSDIAIGTARLFGFNAMRNFNYPFFSRNMSEFWKRWHISLTSWFNDYVFTPLGGSKYTWKINGISKIKLLRLNTVRNIIIMFTLSGLWHGANWTFIIWGFYNSLLFIPIIIFNINRKYANVVAHDRILPNFKEIIQMSSTFLLLMLGIISFRSPTIIDAFYFIGSFFNINNFSLIIYNKELFLLNLFLIIFITIIEWFGRREQYGIQNICILLSAGGRGKTILKYAFYYFFIFTIFLFSGKPLDFIYFQF